MQSYSLKATTRKETKKKVSQLREQGQIPAVLYGHKIKTKNLTLAFNDFKKVYEKAGESALIDLVVDEDKSVKTLVQDVQYDVTKDKIIHVDLHQIKMDEEITTFIPIKVVGESPAVKGLGGTLVTTLDEIEIECLPGNLIHEIELDISRLKTFDDMIHIKDLKVPETIKILKEPEEVVMSIMAPRSEEEMEAMEEGAKVAEEVPETPEEGDDTETPEEGEVKTEEVKAEKK
ncbi:50S ribosomal protein L25 [Patescibacteria group bacterium]|nr:50S ribosomal protein L25 [Patescibacteria group bacterium]